VSWCAAARLERANANSVAALNYPAQTPARHQEWQPRMLDERSHELRDSCDQLPNEFTEHEGPAASRLQAQTFEAVRQRAASRIT
jgi:hypothetical protein